MSTKPPATQTSQDSAFTVQVRLIGRSDLEMVQAAMAEAAPEMIGS